MVVTRAGRGDGLYSTTTAFTILNIPLTKSLEVLYLWKTFKLERSKIDTSLIVLSCMQQAQISLKHARLILKGKLWKVSSISYFINDRLDEYSSHVMHNMGNGCQVMNNGDLIYFNSQKQKIYCF